MSNNLCKEQLLILQNNLSYTDYEKFMELYSDDSENIPEDESERINFIIETMKAHPKWGEIQGWGTERVYKHLFPLKISPGFRVLIQDFMGKTKGELIKYLDDLPVERTAFTTGIEFCLPVED
jgi:hypothetical protein